ncbi:ceramidase-domain-containing protein [Podospora fimiseda]|uniref:Ceramidase-domain-containing protein n=1 Tax=Podospora fimiseda TaxID=252190 RepID=A0AAN7BW20_9PEZI|nr:ceramidase-domain-containing protein [Podospora fimiseda]
MEFFIPKMQVPYREARSGLWGNPTSTLNWCEEDYNITFYCAELVNTLTNLVFMYLGFKGLRNVFKYGHSKIFILAFLGYIVVGIGSMAFHSTLKYEMQLADELPMIYTVCIMAYATFSYNRPLKTQILIATGLVGLAAFITIYYLHAKDPVFHQVAYGLLTLSTIVRGFYVMYYKLKPALCKRNPVQGELILKQMWQLATSGIAMFLTGFFLWNLDNIFCKHITTTKQHLQLPWSVVLEGHGWWHILTGAGAYHLILWRLWSNKCLDGGEEEFVLDWVPMRTVPQVLVREIESQAIAAQQQIGLVRAHLASKQREMRLAQLTRSELSSLPPDTPVYEGVGKMCVFTLQSGTSICNLLLTLSLRFVGLPAPELQDKLGTQIKDIETETEALGKRLHYLETTAKNSQEHIEKMLKGGQA